MSDNKETPKEKMERIKREIAKITAKSLLDELLAKLYTGSSDPKFYDDSINIFVEEITEALYDEGKKVKI